VLEKQQQRERLSLRKELNYHRCPPRSLKVREDGFLSQERGLEVDLTPPHRQTVSQTITNFHLFF